MHNLRIRRRLPIVAATALLIAIGIVVVLLLARQNQLDTSAPPTKTLYEVPPGIARDCSTDVSQSLHSWIQHVPDGTRTTPVTLRFGGGCYQIENSLYLVNRHNLIFEGDGSQFIAKTSGSEVKPHDDFLARHWPELRSQWRIRGGSDLTFRNMIVHGSNPTAGARQGAYDRNLEEQHGFVLNGAKRILIENTTITDVQGDCVDITNYDPAKGSETRSIDVTLRNNRCERTGRMGFSVINGEHVLIDSNYIGDVPGEIIDLEPIANRWLVRDVTIRNNEVGPKLHYALTINGNGPVDDVTFEGNRSDVGPLSILQKAPTTRRHNYRILNNRGTSTGVPTNGLYQFGNIEGLEVAGDYQKIEGYAAAPNGVVAHSGVAVSVENGADVWVHDNVWIQFNGGPVSVLEADEKTSQARHCNNSTNASGQPPGDGPC